jgi:hypothetical protein
MPLHLMGSAATCALQASPQATSAAGNHMYGHLWN